MKHIRPFCILLVLCLLVGCGSGCAHPTAADRPPVHVTYTPDPTSIPEELLESIAFPDGAGIPDPASRTRR